VEASAEDSSTDIYRPFSLGVAAAFLQKNKMKMNELWWKYYCISIINSCLKGAISLVGPITCVFGQTLSERIGK
jgi:hypothetical protein